MWQDIEGELEEKNWEMDGLSETLKLIGTIIKEHPTKVKEPDDIPIEKINGKIELEVSRSAEDSGTGKATSTTVSSISDVSLNVDATMNIWQQLIDILFDKIQEIQVE